MSDEVNLEIEQYHESWLSSFFKWCPTSPQLLREAERKILSSLKATYRGFFVNIGTVIGKEDNSIWTVVTNEDSENTPIVLLHGFGAGSGLWCLNIDSLSASRPVYTFDIIGFGRSSRPKFNSDALEAEAEFINSIEAWREKVNLKKFILLGHSFGGFLAASYAIKNPDRVAHLVLADPWGFPERPLDVAQRYNLPVWAKFIGTILQPLNPLWVVRAAGPLGPKIVQTARPDLTRKFSSKVEDAETNIPTYLYHCNAQTPSGESAFHSLMSCFGWAKFPMIQRMDSLRKEIPITLIYGARSWIDRDPGFQMKYMRKESFVDVQIIQGAGHHVYADRASAFNQIVNTVSVHSDEGTLPLVTEMAAPVSKEGVFDVEAFINARNEPSSQTQSNDQEQSDINH